MKHKYLDRIGFERIWDEKNTKDERWKTWQKEKEKYGFDSREIWNLDSVISAFLYERLKMYLEFSPVVMEAKEEEYNGEIINLKQALERMIDGFGKYLFKFDSNYTPEDQKNVDEAFELLAIWYPYLWC